MSDIISMDKIMIPISEKLPEICKNVIVQDLDGDFYITHRTIHNEYYDGTGNKIKNIIAWLPVHEPYKEVENESTKEVINLADKETNKEIKSEV